MPDVLPWDIAMNNRDRSDVGLWISYKRFDEALEQTRADERQRIFALLEDTANDFTGCGCEGCTDVAKDISWIIGLIKLG